MAAKFAKNLIPHTAIANTDAHDSIRYHIDNEEGHEIMNVIKAHTRDWDVKEAYPQLEHPSDRDCRRNIPIFEKIFTKRLSSSTLGSNTFIQTLLSHMSETIQEKIHLAAIKLDNLTASGDQMAEFFDIATTQYERYITYSILGALGLIMICILVLCYKLLNEFYKIATMIQRNDENLSELISESEHEFQSNLRAVISESEDYLSST